MVKMLEKYKVEEKPRRYELVYLIVPTFTEKEANDISQEVINLIRQLGGKILHRERWKLRKLAYPIRKFSSAYYYLLNFEALPSVLPELNQALLSDDRLLRFLITKMDKWAIQFRESRSGKVKTSREAKNIEERKEEEYAGEEESASKQEGERESSSQPTKQKKKNK